MDFDFSKMKKYLSVNCHQKISHRVFMIQFETLILKFLKKGEKTGWSYVEIPQDIANKILPGVKKSFRVRGRIDTIEISGMNLLPMGEGNYILPLNTSLRKSLRKKQGDKLTLQLEYDPNAYALNAELLEALESDPAAIAHFKSLNNSHQNYFSKWVESAKTQKTRFERIESCFLAMLKKQNYAEMIRSRKNNAEPF